MRKIENSWLYRDSNSDPSVVQSVASPYINYAIPAPICIYIYIYIYIYICGYPIFYLIERWVTDWKNGVQIPAWAEKFPLAAAVSRPNVGPTQVCIQFVSVFSSGYRDPSVYCEAMFYTKCEYTSILSIHPQSVLFLIVKSNLEQGELSFT
jgi:hypothetical protein